MENARTERAKGIRNRPGAGAKGSGNAKKILNRGNEAKDLLNTQDVAFLGPQNELFFSAENPDRSEKTAGVAQVPSRPSGDLGLFKGRSRKGRFQVSGFRCQVSGVRG
jgi:hypothetical protein